MLTAYEIETAFYRWAVEEIGGQIGGGVYRSTLRPYDSEAEDCLVQYLSGINEQTQEGFVNIVVTVPDIATGDGGRKTEDLRRCGEVMRMLTDFCERHHRGGFYIKAMATPVCAQSEGRAEHYVTVGVHYKCVCELRIKS